MVANQKQFLKSLVPQSDGKHAPQTADKPVPVFLVSVNNHFGVGLGFKMMPGFFQLFPQFQMVVNFTVKNRPNLSPLVADGLGTMGQVHNRQTGHAQSHRPFLIKAVVIRTPVLNGLRHVFQDIRL